MTFSRKVATNTRFSATPHSDIGYSRIRHEPSRLTDLQSTLSAYHDLGKTTLANVVVKQLNALHASKYPDRASVGIAALIPMDGYHLTRAQLSAMPDPVVAHARRGAAFTFDDRSYYSLVKSLRAPLFPESITFYAPSFDHAVKDPVENEIAIPPAIRILLFEGNYLSLNKSLWVEAADLMDEHWFVEVDFEVARQRLVKRHLKAGIVVDETEANERVTENDLVNGKEIIDGRIDVQEVVISQEDEMWKKTG